MIGEMDHECRFFTPEGRDRVPFSLENAFGKDQVKIPGQVMGTRIGAHGNIQIPSVNMASFIIGIIFLIMPMF